MKQFILLIAILLGFNSSATHLLGANIYWECVGNGDYVFTLTVYRDCNGSQPFSGQNLIATNAPCGNISVNLISSDEISYPCYDSTLQRTCYPNYLPGRPFLIGTVEKYVFRSGAITIIGQPPAAGWQFYWSVCCRPNGNINSLSSNFFVEAKMYQNPTGGCLYNSPRFLEDPRMILGKNKSFSLLASSFSPGDSISHKFVPSLMSSNTPVIFQPGFSYLQPFPDTSESSLNDPITIHKRTGLVSYGVKNIGTSQSQASYLYNINAQSWRDGQLYSEIYRDMTVYFEAPFSPINNLPKFKIDSLSASHTIVNPRNNLYKLYCNTGDTVNIQLLAEDLDLNANGAAQILSFDAKGYNLDTSWTKESGNPLSFAELSPIFPQSSFQDSVSNKIQFKWVAPQVKATQPHIFAFTVRDDACPVPAVNNFTLVVYVTNQLSIAVDSISLCRGDSVKILGTSLSGNYHWFPPVDIINRDSALASVFPDTSRYYYLTDSIHTSIIDSVYVQVLDTSITNLSFNGLHLIVGNSQALDSLVWYYNGAKFNHLSDSLKPFASGLYWIREYHNNCTFRSNSIHLVLPQLKALTYFDTLAGAGPIDSLTALPGSIGAHFKVYNNNFTWLEGIEMVGGFQSDSTNTKVTLKLYNRGSQQELLSLDTIITSSDGVVRFSFPPIQLSIQEEYSIKIAADSSLLFQVFQNLTVPYDPDNNGLIVTGLSTGGTFKNSKLSQTTFLPIGMRFKNSIGEAEFVEIEGVSIYPNPVETKAMLFGLNESDLSSIKIVDITGRNMNPKLKAISNSIEINFEGISPGIYFIRFVINGDQRVIKMLKK